MAFIGKDPRFRSPILTDVLATTPTSPPSGASKMVNRNGQLLLMDSNGVETPIGGGAGEKNYILSPSVSIGWVASSAAITVSTDTTASELPRGLTTKTGIKITGVSGSSAYVYYRFTLDKADYNKKLKIKLDMNPLTGYVASDFKVDLYSNTASNYGGTSTRIALSSDSSAISALPNATGQFQVTLDMPGSSAPYMELRIGLNASSTQSVVFSDIVVGPGLQPQGAVVGPATAYTPTISAGFGTVASVGFQYSRVGELMFGFGIFTCGTVAASAGTFTLPNGWLANETKIIGRWYRVNAGGSTRKTGDLFSTASSNIINFGNDDYVSAASPTVAINGSSLCGNSEVIYVQFYVWITDLVGSGVLNLAQNDVEYAFNTSTSTTASDTTSFGNGPIGAQIQNITANLSRRVRFLRPIQQTDELKLQVYNGIGWVDLDNSSHFSPTSGLVGPYEGQNATSYGAGLLCVVNATDVEVNFGTYSFPTGATFGANGEGWSNAWGAGYWRIKKTSAGAAVGFGQATSIQRGLVYDRKMYVVGTSYTNGTPALTSAASGFAVSRCVLIPYQTYDGAWFLKVQGYLTTNALGAGPSSFNMAFSGVTFKNVTTYYAPVRSLSTTGTAQPGASFATFNSGTVTIAWPAAQTSFADCNFEFEAELNSKPTWAD